MEIDKNNEIKSLQSQLDNVTEKFNLINESKGSDEMKLNKLDEEYKSKIDIQKTQYEEKIAELQNQIDEQQKIINDQKKSISNIESQSQQLFEKNSEMNDQIQSLKNENENKEKEIVDLQNQISSSNEIRNELKSLQNQLENANNEKKEILSQNDTLKEKVIQIESSNSELTNEISQIKEQNLNEINSLKQEIEKLNQQKNEVDFGDNFSSRSINISEENDELRRQISQLQIQLLDLQSKADNATQLSQKLSLEKNNAIQMANKEISDLKSEIDSMKNLKDLKLENENLKTQMRKMSDIEDENKNLKQLNQSLQKQVLEIDVLQAKIDDLTSKNNTLKDANKNLESSLSEYKKAASDEDKDEKIQKLTILLNRSQLIEKKMQEQIDQLQAKIESLTNFEPNTNSNIDGGADSDLVRSLKNRVFELEGQLNGSNSISELEKKNKKLSKLVEKSNKLYAELLEKNQNLAHQIEILKRPDQITKEKLEIENTSCCISIMQFDPEGNSNNDKVDSKELQNQQNNDKNAAISGPFVDPTMNSYLKRTLLQFFLQDGAKRDEMIPMILELVGCNEQQIATVQRQWARQHQFFSKGGFFGFGNH